MFKITNFNMDRFNSFFFQGLYYVMIIAPMVKTYYADFFFHIFIFANLYFLEGINNRNQNSFRSNYHYFEEISFIFAIKKCIGLKFKKSIAKMKY